MREKHGADGFLGGGQILWPIEELLCPKELCERGVSGESFKRPYRLVNHLVSANNNRFPGQGHGITKDEAQRIVAQLKLQ